MKEKKYKKDLLKLKNKTNSGITLIALIVSIIVLIILAGITLNLLMGDNGILTRAKGAKEEFIKSKMLEDTTLILMDYSAEHELTGITLENYLTKNNISFEKDGTNIKFVEEGFELTVNPITLEIDGPVKANKAVKIVLSKNLIEPEEKLKVTLTFGEEVDIANCKYAFLKSDVEVNNENKESKVTTAIQGTTINNIQTSEKGEYYFYLLVAYKDNTEPLLKKVKVKVDVSATGISLNETNLNLVEGQTYTLIASVLPTNAEQAVTYYTSNENIVTINNSGVVTATGIGTAVVTVKSLQDNNIYTTCQVSVTKAISLNKSKTKIQSGKSETLVAQLNGITGNIIWESNNNDIATVDNTGKIETKSIFDGDLHAYINSVGEIYTRSSQFVEITAKVENTNYKDKCEVEVLYNNIEGTIGSNTTKKIYISNELKGKDIEINCTVKYGRDENSASIYFYDENNDKIENIGNQFEKAGGETKDYNLIYTIPQNCSYIQFWTGDGSYNPYIIINSFKLQRLNVELTNNYSKVINNTVQIGDSRVTVKITPIITVDNIFYRFNEENNWSEYINPILTNNNTLVNVKGEVGTEYFEDIISVTLPESKIIDINAYDNNDSTYCEINDDTGILAIDNSMKGRNITFKIQAKYGTGTNGASIYFYDENKNKIENIGNLFEKGGGETKNYELTYTIPQNCSYIEFWAGNGSYNPYIYLYEITF